MGNQARAREHNNRRRARAHTRKEGGTRGPGAEARPRAHAQVVGGGRDGKAGRGRQAKLEHASCRRHICNILHSHKRV
jgi:hypothetical protein